MALTPTEEAQTRELIAQQAALLSLAGNETVITSKLGAQKVNLSQLPAAGALSDTDIFLVRQGTTDSGVAGSAFKSYTAPSAATESAAGIAEVATQTETNTGTDDARIVTPKKLRAGFAISLTTNGYIAFPTWMGGLIVQWGSAATVAGGSATFTYPISFTSARFVSVSAEPSGNYVIQGASASLSSRSYTVVLASSGAAAPAGVTFNVITIGY